MNLDQRQTGRSTRTRDDAVELAHRGYAVYLLVPLRSMIKPTEAMLNKTWARLYGERKAHGIKVEMFDKEWAAVWDWEAMKPRSNFHSNCQFLMDHTVVEAEIRRQQEIAQRAINRATLLYSYTV